MAKKFDVVIGNPPYQEDSVGESTHNMPIYDKFMEAAYEVGSKAVLITPARFLFNAGYTNKAWNAKMLADPRLSVPVYVPDSRDLFPGTTITGGVAVTVWDETRTGEPIGTFTSFVELNSVLHKVEAVGGGSLLALGITNDRQYRYTDKMHEENPDARALMSEGNPFKIDAGAFGRLRSVFHAARPADGHEYVQVLGLSEGKRTYRWLRRDYMSGPASLEAFKVAVPASRGAGGVLGDQPAVVAGSPLVLEPGVGVTGTFLTIGAFSTRAEADALLRYVKSKFARVMLGILKVTQHNAAHTWRHVPLQDFTDASDIDWSKSGPEIDQQLYVKYGLDESEIAFIESHVKPIE